jgi:hypothetical protein
MESPVAAVSGLIPPTRPQLIGEVLDAGFRLFRVSLLKCLPFAAASVIVSQAPTFYDSVRGGSLTPFFDKDTGWWMTYALAAVFSVWMMGLVLVRQTAVARLQTLDARREARATLKRLPGAIAVVLAYLVLIAGLVAAFSERILPPEVLLVAALPLLWLGVRVALGPYLYWCKQRGVWASFADSFRLSRKSFWRLAAMLIVTLMTVMVFYFVAAIVMAVLAPAAGATDVAVLFALNAVVAVIAGAVGLPFGTALLVVAAEDLEFRQRAVESPGQ